MFRSFNWTGLDVLCIYSSINKLRLRSHEKGIFFAGRSWERLILKTELQPAHFENDIAWALENGTFFDAFKMRLIDSQGVGTLLCHLSLGEIETSLLLPNFLSFSNCSSIVWMQSTTATMTRNRPSHNRCLEQS